MKAIDYYTLCRGVRPCNVIDLNDFQKYADEMIEARVGEWMERNYLKSKKKGVS